MKPKKRILVAPLDWGIGHATRCIPIIKTLISSDFEVILAADSRPLHLLSDEFPQLEMIRLEGYNIKYPKYLPMSISMIFQIPKLLWNIKKENTAIKEIIKEFRIDGIISDNRFGLYSEQVPCVFITHQLEIKTPYFTESICSFNYKYINKYTACWVMDDQKINLAGNLSKPTTLPNNTHYIGILSRFEKQEIMKKYDFLAIVSGPEPQRTILENGLVKSLQNRTEKSLIVLGKPEINTINQIGNLTIKSHLNAKDLNTAISQSELIICRSGYSTIMDLAKLGKKAIFIPTPGQTEQEYLADNFKDLGICYTQKQSQFNFKIALEKSKNYTGFNAKINSKTDWTSLFALFKRE
ncbi:MAG: UDP-N-acetylglucosamine--N-acetylmuramyl-(pentapeptide) pyrophosphoryl-undecaprenol N-acetylglucosamine transferase [Cryomorphaceae bacterium]|nr:MAG: UDP-N-acetylglucosamine--N-acetylmuramyl-(pentapeptide) pyrophosphoryl-undecaprenol N-acetylglucosamine transferase [Cryomorphaceae bacterium]